MVESDYEGTVTTVAGTACGPDSGDSGPATSATLNDPWRTAFDGAGNLYIVELSNVVRRVDGYTGIITTVAGTGTNGYTGDGGAATSATLNNPTAVLVDPAGNLFIADSDNNVVRRVDSVTGIITTIAGLGLDVHVSKHLLLRPIKAEYQYMQLPNNAINPSNQQHDVRLSAGVVLRLTR